MSIDAIKNIQTNIISSKSKTSFTSNSEAQTENNNTGKMLLLAGLTALGAVGIYIASRGKKGASTITESTQRPVEQITEQVKDLTLDAFRQAGNKFEKGMAKLANGENYTGKLTQQLDDGKVVIREYKNGVLQTAKKMDGDNLISTKIYSYDNNGKISDVKLNDEVIYHSFVSAKMGNSKIVMNRKSKYLIDPKTDKIKFIWENNNDFVVGKFFDENGKFLNSIKYDFATGIGQYNYKNMRVRLHPTLGLRYDLYDADKNLIMSSYSTTLTQDEILNGAEILFKNKKYKVIDSDMYENCPYVFKEIGTQIKKGILPKDSSYSDILKTAQNMGDEIITKHNEAIDLIKYMEDFRLECLAEKHNKKISGRI